MSKIIGAEVGDTVYVDGYTSMAQQSAERETITKVTTKYDETTGEPYNVIHIGDRQFDSRHGGAITPPTMYYIENLIKKQI